MGGSNGGGTSLPDDIEGVTNVLLCAPSMEPAAGEACTRLLSPPGSDGERLLFVTLSDSPDDRLAAWRAHDGRDEPEEVAFVAAGDSMRSVAAETASVDFPDPRTTIRTLSNPGDLTGLGIGITEFLTAWEGDDRPATVCVHSLTTLLQYVETQQAFRFLHVLTGRITEVDARAHYHVDPSAHDERTINTLKPLFDATLTFEDGEWTARTR
jgi:hypothetical protein